MDCSSYLVNSNLLGTILADRIFESVHIANLHFMLTLLDKLSSLKSGTSCKDYYRLKTLLVQSVRKAGFCFILLLMVCISFAQTRFIDSLKAEVSNTDNDTLKIKLYGILSEAFKELQPDSCVYFSSLLAGLAEKHAFMLKDAFALAQMGYALKDKGEYPLALRNMLAAKVICEDPASENNTVPAKFMNDEGFQIYARNPHLMRLDEMSLTFLKLGVLYENMNDFKKEKEYQLLSLKYAQESGSLALQSTANSILGKVYLNMGQVDSALDAEQKAYSQAKSSNYREHLGTILLNLGLIYAKKKNIQEAVEINKEAITVSNEISYLRGVVAGNLALSDIFLNSGSLDSALYYGKIAQDISYQLNNPGLMLRAYTAKAKAYRQLKNNDSTVKYQALMILIKDSLQNPKQVHMFENIAAEEERRKQEMETEKQAFRNRLQTLGLISVLIIFLTIAAGLWLNNKEKQKAFSILQNQKKETDIQKSKTEQALEELKATQSQLVQREKMASLGELTSGIAHEIQNPLNFVNNFSEINSELLDELKSDLKSENIKDANELADRIAENEKKIIHHGRRADAIVKGMLQHSRTGAGIKELIDINALVDECMRLSYHGFLAREKEFNVSLVRHLDPQLEKIEILRADMSSVLLNLFNNAFYAVAKKMKSNLVNADGNADKREYLPEVGEETKIRSGGSEQHALQIIIWDNGDGIPTKILDKIFQPFFTTKPAGQGTGLGLSLSYDIIKAHGGEIKVDSTEGEGSTFIIEIPA